MCCEKTRTDIFLEDSKRIWNTIDPERFRDTVFLITGATGLIGATLVRALLYANRCNDLNLRIILWVRDRKRQSCFLKMQRNWSLWNAILPVPQRYLSVLIILCIVQIQHPADSF